MRRIGLTGGVASGKSTVAKMLADRGVELIDADQISKTITKRGGIAVLPIVAVFGDKMLLSNGELDREKMRLLIFSDINHRRQLEGILHPMIRAIIESRATNAANKLSVPAVIFDIPLLTESPYWKCYFESVWVVDCSKKIQLERVAQRNQLSAVMANQIVDSQASREERCAIADAIIFNDNIPLHVLNSQVDKLATHFGL